MVLTNTIRTFGGRSKGRTKVVINRSCQIDVRRWEPGDESGPSENGTKNQQLSSRGICLAVKEKLCSKVRIVIARSRSMILRDLEHLELMMETTGKLSHHIKICLPDQEGSQR